MTHHIKKFGLTLFIVFLVLPKQTYQDLHIWEPPQLRSIYKSKKLEYTIANFGTVPYGHSIYGSVFKATPLDGCNELAPLKWEKNQGTLIIYVERGGCHFAQKVLMAQKIGAGLVIIGDTDNEDVSKILPVERTTALMEKIHIPSLLISKADAENFRNILANPDGPMVSLAVSFDLVKAYDLADIKMILQVDDHRSYDAILNLDQYHNDFKENMSLTIHYKVFKNLPLMINNYCVELKNTYCVLNGHPNLKGLSLLDETLKQMCLYDYNYEEFISYLKYLRGNCFDRYGEVDDKFKACTDVAYTKSVSETTRRVLSDCNNTKSEKAVEMFEANNDNIKYYLINFSPIVFINGFIFKGNYQDSNHLMEAFCNSFEEPPKNCNKLSFYEPYHSFNSFSILSFIFNTILVCLVIAFISIVCFYIFYRRKMAMKFDTELGSRINDALSKYYGDSNDDYMGIRKED